MYRKYFLGDTVKYTGDRLRSLGRKNSAWGSVVGYVSNDKTACVVEFAEGDYVVYDYEIAPYTFSEKQKGPEVVKVSKKWDEI